MKHYYLKTLLCALSTVASTSAFAEDVLPNILNKDLTANPVEWTAGTNNYDANVQLANILGNEFPGLYMYNNEDYTDVKGFRHICFQQVDSEATSAIEGKQIYVHLKNVDGKWMVQMITGDVYNDPSFSSAKTQKPSTITPESGDIPANAKRVSVFEDGKLVKCYMVCKDFKKIYTEIGTGRIVKTESMIHNAAKAETAKTGCTGNRFYYDAKYIKSGKETFAGGTVNGKTVLQTPGKVYTMDYTRATNDPTFNLDEVLTTINSAVDYGVNFEGNADGTFNTELGTNTSILDSLKYVYQAGASEFSPIFAKVSKAGDILASLTLPKQTCSSGSFVIKRDALPASISQTDWDNLLKFTTKSREVDPSAPAENSYMAIVLSTGQTAYIPLCHKSDTVKIYDGDQQLQGYFLFYRHFETCASSIDIHWGLDRTLTEYKETFNIDSYDDKGTPVLAMVNYLKPNNACSMGCSVGYGLMAFGLGSISFNGESFSGFYPMTDLETIGHEFTHLVADKLDGNTDAKALNESYADIIGKMVERKTFEKHAISSEENAASYASWYVSQIMGLGTPQEVLRYFDDKGSDPIFYQGEKWNSNDREEHQDAGVQNHWFYLLCNGGEVTPEKGNKVTVEAINRDDAEFITFSALKYFGTKNTNYEMARVNALDAAKLYFGEGSAQYNAVGNAWYAVGVKQDAWTPVDPSAINAVIANGNLTPSVYKYIKNGKVVIEKNGVKYNAVGQQL